MAIEQTSSEPALRYPLIVERDRLAGRIALLESSIDDMTGTIKKQEAATTAALAARTTPPAPSPPVAAPPASTTPPATNAAAGAATASIARATPAPQADTSTAQPVPVPLPPARVATASANETEPPVSIQSEFGLDLGGGATVEAVRQRWATVKANFGPLLSGMHPLAAHEHRSGSTGYRLVVGPLPNSAAATGLCAHFAAARTACRAVKFDGEQIARQ